MSKKLILIDGHSILNRAFFGIPDLTNSEGIHTNAMYGFLNIMFKFIDEEKPDYITVAFDLSEPTFRHKAYEAYKGTRKPMAPELKQQVPLIKELLRMMNITVIEKAGYEADDIIGTIAKGVRRLELMCLLFQVTGIYCSLQKKKYRFVYLRQKKVSQK